MIDRKPLAPVLRFSDFFAMANSASVRISRSAPSIEKIFLYCFTREFFGSIRICINASSLSSSNVANTGRRPTNSGIKPNLIKSSGSTLFKTRLASFAIFLGLTSAPKPMPLLSERSLMIFSNPSNAPPQMNRMLLVST